MATRKDIFFTIDDDGEVKIEVKGLPGADCLELTKSIEEALGIVSDRQHTSEYYQQEESEKVEVGSGGQ
jgi:hypothetical protein